MATRGHDRLSELPDDLLRRILHFVPLKEAASTTVLSRRWRTRPLLWPSSGALNLETGVESYYHPTRPTRFFTRRDAFVSAATSALDATDVPITRLTVRRHIYEEVLSRSDVANVVLSHRAARCVEELRLVAKKTSDHYFYNHRRLYKVTLDSLPLETLRVLELTHCKEILYEGQHVLLPRLSSLRLSHSVQHLSSLQRIIDAAPLLAAVHLKSVLLMGAADDEAKKATTLRLRCPAAKVLVLDSCTWEEKKRHPSGYEIDAPRLHCFTYKGPLCPFSFSPRPLDQLEQVHLDFLGYGHKDQVNKKDPDRDLDTFWRFARSFTSTREMRLKVNHLEGIAVLSEARRLELLPAFRRLQRLEVQGAHWTKSKAAAVTTILNLLRSCPVLCALRFNLTAAKHGDVSNKEGPSTRVSQKEIQIASLLGPRHLFSCLQSSLRRVGLQFQLQNSDCLGVKLVKFFAENAMVLEEIRINGGDQKLSEHINPKIEKWNSRRKKLGATSFVVLPLNS